MNHNEIAHATDGALRVARRQYIQAARLAQKAHGRLELEEEGDKTREGVWSQSASCYASGYETASKIETELDERNADYKPRSEIQV